MTADPKTNTQVVFVARPTGQLGEEHFELRQGPVPEVGENDVLVRNMYSSVEPYLRVLMTEDTPYAKKFDLDTVLPARVVGEVVESHHPDCGAGDFVYGMLNWEEYSVAVGGEGLRRVDPKLAPLSAYVGVLGPSGLTAYVGMLEVGDAQAGETVYVSAAAGAVGQLAGQLAKMRGARVVGSVGSDEKVAFVTQELGFDAAFNYKTAPDLAGAIRDACPDGIDLDFENVGGANLDAVLECINMDARIVLCGTVSQYDTESPCAVRDLLPLIVKRGTILGFSVRYHEHRLPAYIAEMSAWLGEGRITYREQITKGIENGPAALVGMMRGENIGKQILQIGADTSREQG